jgi:hypothetical protein
MSDNYKPIMSGDPIAATAWLGEVAELDGDEVTIHAELTDVDEVAVILRWFDVREHEVLVHMPRIQAIALAGQLAAAATWTQTALPWGHGSTGAAA